MELAYGCVQWLTATDVLELFCHPRVTCNCVVIQLQIFRRSNFYILPQTVDLTARLPATDKSNLGSSTIRVLVVDPEGLVTIYSPVSPSESMSPAITMGIDVSSKVMAGHRKKINTEVTPTTTKSPAAVSRQCTLAP
jgi:hypothetical protein